MGVRVDGHRHPQLTGQAAAGVGEVQPLRLAVYLQDAAPLRGGLHQPLQVHVVRGALVDQPPCGVRQDVDAAVVHGPQDAFGLTLAGQREAVVHCAHGKVELLQNAVGQVQAAVLQDVDLAGLEHHDAVQTLVDPVDLGDLCGQALGVQTVGHRDVLGVIGDGEVLVAARPRRLGHGADGVVAVAGPGMAVQVATDIAQLHQSRQRSLLGGFHLAAILPELGRDPRQPHGVEHLLLGAPGDPGVTPEHAVLVDLQPALHPQGAHRDVVFLGAGEVVQRRAVAHRRHHPEIHVYARAQPYRGAGGAAGNHLGHLLVGDETLHHPGAAARRDQNVQIPHGVPAAAIAAGHGDRAHPVDALEEGHHGRGCLLGLEPVDPVPRLGHLLDAGEDLRLRLGAETRQPAQPALPDRAFQIGEAADLQAPVQGSHPFRSEPGQAHEGGQRRGGAPPHLLQGGERAGLDDVVDLQRQGLADERQGGEVFAPGHQVRQAVRVAANGAGGVAVGAHAKGVGVTDLHQICQLVEQVGDLAVADRRAVQAVRPGLSAARRPAGGFLPSRTRTPAPLGMHDGALRRCPGRGARR